MNSNDYNALEPLSERAALYRVERKVRLVIDIDICNLNP